MTIINMECPNCGGRIKVNGNQNSCICPFCDSQLTIDDGKFHIVDEAKIMEIQFEQQKYLDAKQKEIDRKNRQDAWRHKFRFWCLMQPVLLLITYVFGYIYRNFSFKLFQYIALIGLSVYLGIIFIGPVYLAITRPDADYEINSPPLIKNKLLFWLIVFLSSAFLNSLAINIIFPILP